MFIVDVVVATNAEFFLMIRELDDAGRIRRSIAYTVDYKEMSSAFRAYRSARSFRRKPRSASASVWLHYWGTRLTAGQFLGAMLTARQSVALRETID
jgi:hypothetical protein